MSSQASTAPTGLQRLGAEAWRTRERVLALRPAYVVGALLLGQWAALLVFALTVRHNGWLYYTGGDHVGHYTGAWLLAHGDLPPAYNSYGWSMLLLPISLLAGPNLASALPVIVLLNTLILLPVALLCMYGIGARIAGRLFGYLVALLWIAIPYLGILLVNPGYHQKYTELTLPQLVGLTALADFPSIVMLLVAAYLCLRVLDGGGRVVALCSGLAVGYSIAMKPSNAIFLAAPALVLLVHRWRALLPFALGLAPSVLTLALWKYRGLGQIPAFSMPPPQRLALGASTLFDPVHHYTRLNSWSQLHNNLLGLREHFWASRVLEWLPLAGAAGLLARSRRGFLFVASWFAAFLLLKGTYAEARMDDASFFRVLMPAFPAYVLLIASVSLLVPGVRPRPARPAAFPLRGQRLAGLVAAAFLLFAVAPLAVVAATSPLGGRGTKALAIQPLLVPVDARVNLRAVPSGTGVRLTWRRQSAAGARLFYRVLRTDAPDGGISCASGTGNASEDCRFTGETVTTTRASALVDHPRPGSWLYRIGVSANWLDDFRYGDVYMLSRPATVTLR